MQQRYCPDCNKSLTWIPQYQKWYCKKEKIYPDLLLCPLCQQPLHWIPQYKRWYCYNDTTYLPLPPPPPPSPKSPYELKLEKAEEMRNNPTPAEERMMEILNLSVIPNFPEHIYHFQSLQYGYTLDFYFPTLKLAIEIDGGSHNNKVGYDWERDTNLERKGIRTLRASNNQVFNNPQGLADSLCKIIPERIEQEYKRNMRYDRDRYRRRY